MTRPLQEGKSKFAYTIDFPVGRFFLDRALYVIVFSVLDIGVMYLWPWFDSQTLHGSLQLFQVIR